MCHLGFVPAPTAGPLLPAPCSLPPRAALLRDRCSSSARANPAEATVTPRPPAASSARVPRPPPPPRGSAARPLLLQRPLESGRVHRHPALSGDELGEVHRKPERVVERGV